LKEILLEWWRIYFCSLCCHCLVQRN